MDMDEKIITNGMQPVSAKLVIAQGVIQNLPEIIGAIREIFALHKEEQKHGKALQSRLDELNINKETFKFLVENLTELSKSENADVETKAMYRDLVKKLFGIFITNRNSSQDFSNYTKGL